MTQNNQAQARGWGETSPESFYTGWGPNPQQSVLINTRENTFTGAGRWTDDPDSGRVLNSTSRWGESTIKHSAGLQSRAAQQVYMPALQDSNGYGDDGGGRGRRVHFN